jgi:hypothetical protein
MSVSRNKVVVAELLKQLENTDDSFLGVIKSMDDKVDNETIDFNEIGADPTVLIDNSTYPIAAAERTDEKRPVALKKLDTTNTDITDDDLQALPYDKKSSVIDRHKVSLLKARIGLGAFSLTPASHTSDTPVIKTTGDIVNLRRRFIGADLVALKAECDRLQIPPEARNLVLCNKHCNDLLLVDQSFKDRYYNTTTGKIITNLLSFNIFESIYTPKFNGTTYAKKAYGASGAGTDIDCSFFFNNINTMKATGTTKMYLRDAATDPDYRKTRIGFRQYFIVSPVQNKNIGAIVDEYTGS